MCYRVPLRRTAVSVAALSVFLAASSANAIEVTVNDLADDLAGTLFLDTPGISNVEATLSGFSDQFGTFTNNAGTYGLPQQGIVLSTGNVADYGTGPNTSGSNSTGFGGFGEEGGGATPDQQALLDQVTGGGFAHFDVAQLTITFDAADDVDTVTFFGVFGSEEFPEFFGSTFLDGFGLFVNGENVAFAGESGAPININHPDFLGARSIDDGEGGGGDFGNEGEVPPIDGEPPFVAASLLDQNEEGGGDIPDIVVDPEIPEVDAETLEPGDPRLALVTGTELDGVIAPGVNPVLRFDVEVEAGASNTFEIIIADTGDAGFDSTVYLSSFQPQEFDFNDGSSEFAPLLPNDPDPNDGIFVFDLPDDLDLGEIFFIDPPVAVGYTYTVTDAEFSMIQAPSLATIEDIDGYQIDFIDISGQARSFDLGAGELLDVSIFGVTEFVLSGIDVSLSLDPNDPLAFPLGVALQNVDPNGPTPTITQAALTEDVQVIPLPGGLPLYLGALGAFFAIRRFRRAA